MRPLLAAPFRASLLTIGACLWFLFLLWRDGELHGRTGVVLCVWFLAAAATQVVASSTPVWIVGMLAQLLLAITLILQRQMNNDL